MWRIYWIGWLLGFGAGLVTMLLARTLAAHWRLRDDRRRKRRQFGPSPLAPCVGPVMGMIKFQEATAAAMGGPAYATEPAPTVAEMNDLLEAMGCTMSSTTSDGDPDFVELPPKAGGASPYQAFQSVPGTSSGPPALKATTLWGPATGGGHPVVPMSHGACMN